MDDFRGYVKSQLGGDIMDNQSIKHVQQINYLVNSVSLKLDDESFPLALNTLLDLKLKEKKMVPKHI